MKNEENIFHELKEISPLIVQIKKLNVYTVPPTYFSNFLPDIIKKIKPNQQIDLSLPLAAPYIAPENYFDSLSSGILKKIKSNCTNNSEVYNETELIAPVLNTISKKEIYTVPDDFFENRAVLLSKAVTQKAKVIKMPRRSKFFRLSVAAAVASVLAVGLYIVTERNFKNSSPDNTALGEVRNLSKEEIVDFLKNNSPLENITSALPVAQEIKGSLKQISDKEIQQFLKETGESDDI